MTIAGSGSPDNDVQLKWPLLWSVGNLQTHILVFRFAENERRYISMVRYLISTVSQRYISATSVVLAEAGVLTSEG